MSYYQLNYIENQLNKEKFTESSVNDILILKVPIDKLDPFDNNCYYRREFKKKSQIGEIVLGRNDASNYFIVTLLVLLKDPNSKDFNKSSDQSLHLKHFNDPYDAMEFAIRVSKQFETNELSKMFSKIKRM